MDVLNDVDDSSTVCIVDDDDCFRTAVTRALGAHGLNVVGYRCAGEYLLAGAADFPGCVLLDMSMPGPNGMELLEALAARETAPPVIFVTACCDVPTSIRAMRLGAVDFLVKPVSTDALLYRVKRALHLDAKRRVAKLEIRTVRECYATLTESERAVLVGIANGKLNKQLAGTLGTCERTIKTYRARAMTKMHAQSVADVVKAAALLQITGATGGR